MKFNRFRLYFLSLILFTVQISLLNTPTVLGEERFESQISMDEKQTSPAMQQLLEEFLLYQSIFDLVDLVKGKGGSTQQEILDMFNSSGEIFQVPTNHDNFSQLIYAYEAAGSYAELGLLFEDDCLINVSLIDFTLPQTLSSLAISSNNDPIGFNITKINQEIHISTLFLAGANYADMGIFQYKMLDSGPQLTARFDYYSVIKHIHFIPLRSLVDSKWKLSDLIINFLDSTIEESANSDQTETSSQEPTNFDGKKPQELLDKYFSKYDSNLLLSYPDLRTSIDKIRKGYKQEKDFTRSEIIELLGEPLEESQHDNILHLRYVATAKDYWLIDLYFVDNQLYEFVQEHHSKLLFEDYTQKQVEMLEQIEQGKQFNLDQLKLCLGDPWFERFNFERREQTKIWTKMLDSQMGYLEWSETESQSRLKFISPNELNEKFSGKKGVRRMKQDQIDELVKAANAVKENSYSPYSKFRVGAAILMDDGQVVTGANIENVSFGATNCAERSAIFTAISQGYQPKTILAIAVSGDTDEYLPPCSICRQVMVEFCLPETPVYLTRNDGKILTTTVKELVPFAFETMDM